MRTGPWLFLYSTNCWLSYVVAQEFYRGEHYVWCTPYFDSEQLSGFDVNLPPTSCPKGIYLSLSEEVVHGDRHSAKIKSLKKGILKGAAAKLAAGVIDPGQAQEIRDIVAEAEIREFKPVLYVISYALVEPMLVPVPVRERAHPLSPEYHLHCLPRGSFDVLEFH